MNDMNRLRWKCRRGMLELDLVLNRFLDLEYDRLDAAQQDAFSQLLETGDEALWGMIADPDQFIDPEHVKLVTKLRAC